MTERIPLLCTTYLAPPYLSRPVFSHRAVPTCGAFCPRRRVYVRFPLRRHYPHDLEFRSSRGA